MDVVFFSAKQSFTKKKMFLCVIRIQSFQAGIYRNTPLRKLKVYLNEFQGNGAGPPIGSAELYFVEIKPHSLRSTINFTGCQSVLFCLL